MQRYLARKAHNGIAFVVDAYQFVVGIEPRQVISDVCYFVGIGVNLDIVRRKVTRLDPVGKSARKAQAFVSARTVQNEHRQYGLRSGIGIISDNAPDPQQRFVRELVKDVAAGIDDVAFGYPGDRILDFLSSAAVFHFHEHRRGQPGIGYEVAVRIEIEHVGIDVAVRGERRERHADAGRNGFGNVTRRIVSYFHDRLPITARTRAYAARRATHRQRHALRAGVSVAENRRRQVVPAVVQRLRRARNGRKRRDRITPVEYPFIEAVEPNVVGDLSGIARFVSEYTVVSRFEINSDLVILIGRRGYRIRSLNQNVNGVFVSVFVVDLYVRELFRLDGNRQRDLQRLILCDDVIFAARIVDQRSVEVPVEILHRQRLVRPAVDAVERQYERRRLVERGVRIVGAVTDRIYGGILGIFVRVYRYARDDRYIIIIVARAVRRRRDVNYPAQDR